MKDFLQDVIQYMHGLGDVDLVKVTGTDQETKVTAVANDKSVIVSCVFNNPVADAVGTFGMPNLGKLKTILGFSEEYDEHAQITLVRETRDGEDIATTIHFESKDSDFVNDYRLMAKNIVENKVKNVSFKGATWNVEFEPTVQNIQRLKRQAAANSEEPYFSTKVENGDLKIYFGDHSTHSGNFVFEAGVKGTMSKTWNWPVKAFLAIMDMPGTKTVKISDQGATEIVVDSGLAVYSYILPAQAK
jgi:hypothetical protein